MNAATLSLPPIAAAILRQMGYDSAPVFGSLWHDPAYVMNCLCVYLREEGHTGAFGRTVGRVAETFLSDPYEATGEELSAIYCLLTLGCADMPVTVQQGAPSPIR